MLADRMHVVVAGVVSLIATLSVAAVAIRESSEPAEVDGERRTICGGMGSRMRLTPEKEAIIKKVLHEATCPHGCPPPPPLRIVAELEVPPVRMKHVVESDWARAYRVTHDGPIQTWTTMDRVMVPAIDHRMFDRVRPLCPDVDDGRRGASWVAIDLRDVADGDAEAALAQVQAIVGVQDAFLTRYSHPEFCDDN